MKIYKNYIVVLFILFLSGLNCFGQSNKEEKEYLKKILQKNEWFIHKKFLLNTTIKKYNLIAVESKEQYRDSIGVPIIGFNTNNNRFVSSENLPRCNYDPSDDSNIYGTYKIFDKNNLKVEMNVPVGNEVIMADNGTFTPKETKKSTFYFKIIIKEENKILLERIKKEVN